jgi:hypothetical protein
MRDAETEKTMTSDGQPPRYELRGARLYVNGERQAVAAPTVIAATALYRAETKDPVDPVPGECARIPEDLALLILRMEARKAIRGLREELAVALTAGPDFRLA